LRLHRNESPYGLSPAAAEVLRNALGLKPNRYPIEEPAALAEALAKRHGVTKEEILLGCGSIEILTMATGAFCSPSRTAVVAEPTFEAVVNHCPLVHARAVKVKLTADYKHDLAKIGRAARQGVGLIFFCNPSNPAGSFIDKVEVEKFVRRLPRNVVLLADEAYGNYVTNPDFESCLRYAREGLPVVVSHTFSKVYGMAGLRVGYAIGRKDLLERMAKRRLANNPNQIAIAAALASLADDKFADHVREMNAEARNYVCGEVRDMGLTYIPSEANFVMIGLGRPAKPVIDALKERKILVGRLFTSMPSHMRVSLGTLEEMRLFIKQFKEVLSSNAAAVGRG